MGFKFADDKIGALTQVAGTIYLAPSLLTIGGQQYRTLLPLTVQVPAAVTASSTYMIYAVVTNNVVSLVISLNVNSVGPGVAAYKLVGAFIATLTGFGAFCTIKGTPTTPLFSIGNHVFYTTGNTATAATKGTVVKDTAQISRNGDRGNFKFEYYQSSGGSATTGDNLVDTRGFNFDLTKQSVYTPAPISAGLSNATNLLGTFCCSDAANHVAGAVAPYSATSWRGEVTAFVTSNNQGYNRGMWNSPNFFTLSNLLYLSADFPAAIAGWSNTPLEDL